MSIKKATLIGGFLNGGGGGIRTHGTRERSTVFKTAPINRSGTPPNSFSDTFYFVALGIDEKLPMYVY